MRRAALLCLLTVAFGCGGSSSSGPVAPVAPNYDFRVESLERGLARFGWRLAFPVDEAATHSQRYMIGVIGAPGRAVGLTPEQWERQRLTFEGKSFGSTSISQGETLRVSYDLEWFEGELGFSLVMTTVDPRGVASGSTTSWRFIPEWKEASPLDELRWIAPVGELVVPEGGMNLIALGSGGSVVRIARVEDWPD